MFWFVGEQMPDAMTQKVVEGQLLDKEDEDEDKDALNAFDSDGSESEVVDGT